MASDVRCSDRSRRGADSTTATAESRGWSTRAVSVSRCKWFLPPNRSTRIGRCNATWSRSRSTRALIEEAELLARQILRNSQRAVRSAKETILEVIGKPLDDQLRIEGWNSYTCVDQAEAREFLSQFFDKSDVGRAGANSTEL